ncbi:MAG: class I SAM-dependent methyltransferase [Gammaproteobacteria bacterium]|nr:class I SAM-dependent methyltransferase [Gammaproteobacteria bacterium]
MTELVDSGSLWSATKTFFPLFVAHLEKRVTGGRVLVVGASDGKFVIPLARRGWHVTAVEVDTTAIRGGRVSLPDNALGPIHTPGLITRLSESGLSERVDVIEADVRELSFGRTFDAAFTSCSWHYSRNGDRPVATFVTAMAEAVKGGGLFCAEYMMPVSVDHFTTDRYMVEGQLRHQFSTRDWLVLEEFYTSPFVEAKHIGVVKDHVHRMGLFLAERVA